MEAWNTACPDWEDRIREGRSLVPDLPLFAEEAERALRVFKRLRVPDVQGNPTIGEIAGPWLFPIVAAAFGSYDAGAGIRMLQEYFLCVSKKNAKALALDTLIATPSGFTTMAGLRVGDMVVAADGTPSRVTEKSEIFLGRPCFEVEFSTGEMITCDAEHLWVTDAHADRERTAYLARKRGLTSVAMPSVKTTAEIARTLTIKSGDLLIRNHRTALCAPLDLPEARLPIPPYALGAWLGDGTTVQAVITTGVGPEADEMVERLVACGQPAFVRARYLEKGSASISLAVPDSEHMRLGYRFRTEATKLGLLGNKHIPQAYLRASVGQRLELLRGLVDTDGSVSARGQVSITTTRAALRDGIVELVNSLGLKATWSEHRATLYGKDCGPSWNVQFWASAAAPPVSYIPAKADRQRRRAIRPSAERSSRRQIVAVRPVPSVATQCIAIDNPTRQYLVTRSLIPTHNTSSGAAIMLTALIVNERPEADLTLVAPTKEVADRAFKQAAGSIRLDEQLTKLFHIQRHVRTITHRRTGAVLQVRAADTDVITGVKSTFTLIDETHVFASRSNAADVFLEIRGSLAARPDGFVFQITTQSKDPPAGVFRSELHKARDVRDGKLEFPLLPVLYEFPPAMVRNGDWRERRYWHMTNPNLGRSVNEDFLVREVMAAEREGPVALALIASQHLNVEIGIGLRTDAWPGAEYWTEAERPHVTLDWILEQSEVVCIGIDGGGLDDLFGVCVLGRAGQRWYSWSHGWCHHSVLERRRSIAARLRDFERAGELTIVDDALEDLSSIVALVQRVKNAGVLGGVAVDPAGIGSVVDALAEIEVSQENDLLVGIGQGFRLMNALKTAERRLANGTLQHGVSELMAWCVSNLRIEPTATAIRATKRNAGDAKIDLAMAMFNAVDLMTTNPSPEGGHSIYANMTEAQAIAHGLQSDASGTQTDAQQAQIGDRSSRFIDTDILTDPSHPRWQEMRQRVEEKRLAEAFADDDD